MDAIWVCLPAIRVTSDAPVLTLEFTLAVK
jgi:hypothetical protein